MTNWTFEAFDELDEERLITQIDLARRAPVWSSITVVSDIVGLHQNVTMLTQVQRFIDSANVGYVYYTNERSITLAPIRNRGEYKPRSIYFITPEEAISLSLTDTVIVLGSVDRSVYAWIDESEYVRNAIAISSGGVSEEILEFILQTNTESSSLNVRLKTS